MVKKDVVSRTVPSTRSSPTRNDLVWHPTLTFRSSAKYVGVATSQSHLPVTVMLSLAALALATQAAAFAVIADVDAGSPTSDTGRSLLVTSKPDSTPCLTQAYYGSYGGSKEHTEHIYLPTHDCIKELPAAIGSDDIHYLSNSPGVGRLVWVGLAGLDPSTVTLDMDQSWVAIRSQAQQCAAAARWRDDAEQAQRPFLPEGQLSLVRQTPVSLLLHVPDAYVPILDTLLPPHLVPVALPRQPLPLRANIEAEAWEPVPRHFAEHLGNLTKHLRFDPVLGEVLNEGIQMDKIRRDVRWLTGEAPSGIESRHSFTPGAIKAAHWIKGVFPPCPSPQAGRQRAEIIN